ncbi:MAG: NAD(P)-dependent glycerol-3-phosphate dehydrogenase [Planctomycetes bacterium]|nr:NAD(P)-dependent glycerol-3-phosphate dehydrogenase [Planctomycetota bacterium]
MYTKVSIIGDGAMGSVCGVILCGKSVKVRLWGYDADYVAQIKQTRENSVFLPGYRLPDELELESDDSLIMEGAELLISAVPCQFMRGVWERLKPYVPESVPIVSVAKGIENKTLLRPSEILKDILGGNREYAVLSGPTIADELIRSLPATACVGSFDVSVAKKIQETFNTSVFRVYTNEDMVGVEIAGALKNVIAIAAGIIDGVGAGDNAKAALVTRGLAEIRRLGIALGARSETFSGLSGLGDLVTTCISPRGRNRSFGERIGKGQTAQEALGATESVVEGAATCESVLELAGRLKVEMPICQAVGDVISGKKSVHSAILKLMTRQLKSE